MLSRVVARSAVLRRTATRSFAAKAAPKEDEMNPFEEMMSDADQHAPPVALFGTNARFANAAYRAASRDGALDAVQKDLSVVVSLVTNDDEVANFFADPSVGEEDKIEAVKEMAAEGKMHEVTTGLLEVIADNGKLKDIDKITGLFGELMDAKKGVIRGVVTSAEALAKKDLTAVTKALEKRLGKGQTLALSQVVDASIIGGLLVEMGDELADLSVSSGLQEAQTALTNED